jgi:hypothetical protein
VDRLAVFIFVAAAVVFCGVQDRVTAGAARRYVAIQRAALAVDAGPAVTIDEVMRPAVRRSVYLAAFWSGMVVVAGFGIVRLRASAGQAASGRRGRRE